MTEEVMAVRCESTGFGNMHQCHGRQKGATPGMQERNMDSEVASAERAQPPTTNHRVTPWPVERVLNVCSEDARTDGIPEHCKSTDSIQHHHVGGTWLLPLV